MLNCLGVIRASVMDRQTNRLAHSIWHDSYVSRPKLETVAISAALTPEAARSVLALGFNHEAEMHHPTKFQQNQAVRGSFIDDSTNLRLGGIL